MKTVSKKLLALLLTLLMLIGMMPAGALAVGTEEPIADAGISVQAADTAAISLGSVSGKPGETVEVPLNLTNGFAGGFACLCFDVEYDKDSLELTGVKAGAGAKTADLYFEFTKGGSTVTVFDNDYNLITDSGELIILTFAIKDSAAAGSYAVNLKESSTQTWFMTGNAGIWETTTVVPTVTAGSVAVAAAADSAAITFGSASGAQGDTISVPVVLKNGFKDGFKCLTFEVTYDEDSLELTGVEPGADAAGIDLYCGILEGTSSVMMLDNSNAAIKTGGEMLVLKFKVKDSAAAGDYTVGAKRSTEQDFFTVGEFDDISAVVPTITSGTVNVVEVEKITEITEDYTITEDGVYHLGEGVEAAITVASGVHNVTIIGNGVVFNDDATDTDATTGYGYISSTPNAVTIDCTAAVPMHLTIRDLYNVVKTSGKNILDFSKMDSTLTVEGTCLIDYDYGYTSANDSIIHVKYDDDLIIKGDGTLYLYNCTQGAGIGGNTGELNGDIIFDMDGSLFLKSTRQGAAVGAGARANSNDEPGAITFKGNGNYYIVTNSRGAAIGGSAGADGASAGTLVFLLENATLSVNTDFSGAGIGGGGYKEGNDSSGGNLYVEGGSVRPYVDTNAVNNGGWNGYRGKEITEAGVNDAIITAYRRNNNGDELFFCTVDISGAEADENGKYKVTVDGAARYTGAGHNYSFAFDGVDRDETWNTTPISTIGNWIPDKDTNLYLFLTGEDHVISVNGVEKTYYWDEETQTFSTEQKFPVTFNVTPTDANIVVSKGMVYTYLQDTFTGVFHEAVEAVEATEDTPAVAASPAVTVFKLPVGYYTATITKEGYYASQFSFQVKADGTVASIAASSNVNNYLSGGVFTITLPTFTKSANEGAWDGVTLDVSWYGEDAKTMYISTPAQLAGMAAIVNGIYNAEITTIIDDVDGDGTTETYTPAEYAALEKSKINAAASAGDTSGPNGNNLVTSSTYWYGVKSDGQTNSDFNGQTVYITANLDMGGYVSGNKWTGARYMPIGGQSLMHYIDYSVLQSDGYSHLGASFNGTLDGQGHIVKNMYCDRYAAGTNFGDSQSVGLIGRLGNHDNDPKELAAVNPTVRNIAVSGDVYARRSVGGVVGKIGQTSASVKRDGSVGGIIENCLNFCSVSNTDSKGVGGIAGAGWNKGVIRNCANFGSIDTTYRCPAGGISGSNEVPLINCYNVGSVTASSSSYAMGIGTNNGGDGSKITNCFWLTGMSAGGGYYGSGSAGAIEVTDNYNGTELKAADYMKSALFLKDVNGTGRGWVFAAETDDIYALMSSTGNAGYPIPREFIKDETTIVKIEKTADPTTLEYIAGQSFDAAGMEIWATYSDDTKELLDDYTLSIDRALETTDTEITVSGTHSGMEYSYTFKLTVAENSVNEIKIAANPTNMIYGAGEEFDITGIKVNAYYANFPTKAVALADTDYTWVLDENNLLVVSYEYNGKTVTASVQVTYLDTPAPSLNEDGKYVITCENDLIWFANQVNTAKRTSIGAVVTADLDMPETFEGIGKSGSAYIGEFDGGNHTIKVNMTAQFAALFPYVANATIKNVVVDGTVTGTYAYAGAAGLVAYAADGKVEGSWLTIENCVNKAEITGLGYVGGITGKTQDATFKVINCVNYGTITNSGSNAGGISAYISMSNKAGAVIIDGCKNYGAINGTKSGSSHGGIVGYFASNFALESYYIRNCMNYGDIVSAANCVGGIVGQTKGKNATIQAVIENCGNEGNVTGLYSVGGIAGEVSSYVTVNSCYNTGDIAMTGKQYYRGVGGVIGTLGKAEITNVYNVGGISLTNAETPDQTGAGGIIGGIFGAGGKVTNAYSAGTITTAGAAVGGEVGGYLYQAVTLENCYALDLEGFELIGGSNATITQTNVEAKTSDELKAMAETLGEAFKANPVEFYHGGYPALVWEELPHVHSYGENGFCASCGEYNPDAEAYIVSTAAQLEKIAAGVNLGDSFSGKKVTLANSIDLAEYENWAPIGGAVTQIALEITSQDELNAALEEHFMVYDSAGASYVRGSEKNGVYDENRTYYYQTGAAFAGTFDGAGYEITNLCVNTDSGYAGLFGNVSGTVKNLTVRGSVTSTTSQDFVGGITGKLSAGGTIYRCTSYVTVDAVNGFNIGGIAGFVGEMGVMVSDDNPAAVIDSCENFGSVSGKVRVGGIAGRSAGIVRYSANHGTILNYSRQKKGTGGIVGMNGVNNAATDAGIIEYCYNDGYVNGNGGFWTGGIAGFQNAASRTSYSYNAGTLYTSASATGSLYSWVNPIVGQNEGSVNDCLWLNENTGDNTANYVGKDPTGVGNSGGTAANITGMTREELRSSDAVKALNVQTEAFKESCGSFPVLMWQEAKAHNFVDHVCTECGATEEVTLPGDANGDGIVDATDAVLILRYYADAKAAEGINLAAADVDGNGIIDANDAVAVLRIYAGA